MPSALTSHALAARAATHAALGDPHRLAIVDELRRSDRAPSDLARLLDVESNLLAHHLDVLERARLIERLQSEGDRRRRYLRLRTTALEALQPAAHIEASNVLFVCTENSARSQLAAALWNSTFDGHAESAGTHPADRVHPLAVETAARNGLDLTHSRPRSLQDVDVETDLVITVCDRAHEELASAGRLHDLHWSVPDPALVGTRAAFASAFRALRDRIAMTPRLRATA